MATTNSMSKNKENSIQTTPTREEVAEEQLCNMRQAQTLMGNGRYTADELEAALGIVDFNNQWLNEREREAATILRQMRNK